MTTDPAISTVTTVLPPAKPGIRTSEFWLKLIANALSVLFASGLITGSIPLAIAGIAAVELGSLGYTVARTSLKNASGGAVVTSEPAQ